MTLIVSCVTKDAVYQLADGQITGAGPTQPVMETRRIKQVCLSNRFIIGFSGRAILAEKNTDIWLAEVLAELPRRFSVQYLCAHVQKRAEMAISNLDKSEQDRTVNFQGVGWVTSPTGKLRSCMFTIWTNQGAGSAKSRSEIIMEDSGVVPIRTIGDPGSSEITADLRKSIGKIEKKIADPQNAILRVLDKVLRDTRTQHIALRCKSTISENHIAGCIPRKAVERDIFMGDSSALFTPHFLSDAVSFVDLADSINPDSYAAHLVEPGGLAVTNIVSSSVRNNGTDDQKVYFQFRIPADFFSANSKQ